MSKNMNASDFPFFPAVFLVGAPRCGTTSVSKLLAAHPEICFSKPKELNYFGMVPDEALADIQRNYLDRYFAEFDANRHRLAAEGSVTYLYEQHAIERILAIQPEARFIVAIRNPVDMLRSYHARLLYLLEEDETDFETAWDLQDARGRGERIPRRCSDPRRLQYRQVASLGMQIERLIATAGRERCHVVVADDVRSDPVAACRGLLRFCGVSDAIDGIAEINSTKPFPHRHKNKIYRWRWLQQLLYKPPKVIFKAAERSEMSRGVRPMSLKQIHKKLARFNRTEGEAPRFAPAFRERLLVAFKDDVRLLERILGRTLDGWKPVSKNA